MKILLISNKNPHFVNTNVYRLDAIEALGHEPYFFDNRQFLFPGRLRQKFNEIHQWDLRRMNQMLIASAQKLSVDICLFVGGYNILKSTIDAIRAQGITTVLWTTDVPDDSFNDVAATASAYDYVFCAGTEAVEILSQAGVAHAHWLPFACDPHYHRFERSNLADRKKYQADIVFVGSYYPNRAEILSQLVDFDMKIWGPHWDHLPVDSPLRGKVISKHLNYTEWVKIYNNAKIVFVLHYHKEGVPCYQASPKLFEAMACQSFVMTDRQKDALTLFDPGYHFVDFENIADLREKIRFYINDHLERDVIRLNGFYEVIRKHTYTHRIQEMLNRITSAHEKN